MIILKTYNNIDESIKLLRELQSMIFDENIETEKLFSKTVEIDKLLNESSIEYNKYINDKKQNLKYG